jgi:hypothetical protein
MMLQASERDIQSFAGFSKTLNEFVQQKAKAHIEERYEAGLASVINGDMQPSQDDLDAYDNDVAGLKAQAGKDQLVADQMEQQSIPLANLKRVNSPAVDGWYAYGQAVGYVKKAAGSAYGTLGSLMNSDTPLSIPMPDGTVASIIPNQIKDPVTWETAWRYQLQQYIANSGIKGINPTILAKELTPTIMQVRGQLMSARMTAAQKELQAETIENNNISITQGIQDLAYKEGGYTSQDLANFWQEQSAAMAMGTGLARGEANSAVIKRMAGSLLASNQTELLDQFKNVPLLADQPNGITLGQYYAEEFFAASQGIVARNDALEARQTKEDQQAVDDILDERTRGLINTPADAAAITAATREQLTRLNNSPGGNKAALKAILALDSADNSYSPVNYPRLLQQFRANPDSYSSAAAKDLYIAGNINAEEYAKLEKQFGSSDQSERTKKFQGGWQKQVASVIQGINRNKGVLNESSNSFANAITVGTSELNDKINQFLRTKPNATDQEIGDVAQNYLENMAKDNRFTFEPDPKTGQLVQVNPFTRGNFVVPYYKPDGTNKLSRDFTKISNPAILKQSNPMPTVDRILTPQELQAAKERLRSGQQPTARVLSQMQATGLSTEQLVRAQSRAYGLPTSDLDSSKATKASRERLLYAPAAAAILANPNASSIQRIRAWGDIADAKQRAQRRAAEGKALGAGPDLMPGARVSMNDYVRLGIQNGLSADEAVRFAAVGMAESTGQSGVVGKEFPVYGLWQINMAGAMGPDRMRRYGFRSAEELKDPETNARVAVALYKDKGINDWSAYTDGRYRQYLADAKRAYYELKRAGFASKANGNAGSQAILLGRQLLGQGYKIWQHPNFDLNKGYVSGGARVWKRPYDSAHNHGEALDFPLAGATGGNNTPEQLDKLAAMLNANKERFGIRQVLWRTKGHDDHLHVDFKSS